MKNLSNEKKYVLVKAVSTYLYVLDGADNKDNAEYNLLVEIYNDLVDLRFNKGGK